MRKLTTFPALIAIGCLITVSSWWFLQLSVSSQLSVATINNLSLQALRTVLLLQLMSITFIATLWARNCCNLEALQPASKRIIVPVLSAVFPAWPLLALLWLATGVTVAAVAITEAFVFVAGLGLSLLAFSIQRLALNPEMTRLMRVSLGLVAATSTWIFRDTWLQWIVV